MRSAFLRVGPTIAPGVRSSAAARPESWMQKGNGMAKKNNGHTASTPVTSVEEYKVGPGRPPKEHQFKPGQSGNPKGRKRKPASLVPDLKRLFEQALAQKLTLHQSAKELILTMP